MVAETLQTVFSQIKDVILNFDIISDTLDILLVAFIVYGLIMQLRKSQSIQVIKGIILIVIAYAIVAVIGMKTSSFIFSKLFGDIIVIFVVLFSVEIRHALENVGKRRFSGKFSFFSSNNDEEELVDSINAVCRACGAMSRSKVGSLIVFQRNTLLGNITKQAVPINAVTTYEMICSIFYPKAPLHDGAVVIKDGKIVAARCVIPMKNDRDITESVGTRHRAALEVSFNSDAVVVVTSEETGMISLAVDGQLKRGMSDSELRELLCHYLLVDNTKQAKKSFCFKKKDNAECPVQIAAESAEIVEETELQNEISENANESEENNNE